MTDTSLFDLPRPSSVERPATRPVAWIFGGGITGLTLACSLARQGVAAVLLDEDNTVGVKGAASRGICYTQKSLEIFHRRIGYRTLCERRHRHHRQYGRGRYGCQKRNP